MVIIYKIDLRSSFKYLNHMISHLEKCRTKINPFNMLTILEHVKEILLNLIREKNIYT